MESLKLIWDFRGPDAQKIAEHHVVHLKEFMQHHNYNEVLVDSKVVSEFYTMAFIVVLAQDMLFFRDHLKPHRGERL